VYRTPDVFISWLRRQYSLEPTASKKSHSAFHVVIHSFRDPVDTILSGYNYHKLMSVEKRTHKHHYDSLRALTRFVEHGPKDAARTEWCYNRMFFDEGSRLKLPEHLLSRYTIRRVLERHFSLSDGLQYEFERFRCLEMSIMRDIYRHIEQHAVTVVDSPMSSEPITVVAANINMKDFETDFEATTQRVFGLLGIRNRTEQAMLRKRFEGHTTGRAKGGRKVPQKKRGHVTAGKYDREQQIGILLGQNVTRCNVIKQWTLHLDLEWGHSTFC